MIIIRQKQFNVYDLGNFAYFYDENGNLKPFERPEDKKKYEIAKKKMEEYGKSSDPKERRIHEEYKAFVRNGYKKPGRGSSSNSESGSRSSGSYNSGNSHSSSSNSGSGSGYNSGFGGYSWNQKSQEDIKKEEEKRKHDEKEHRTANRLFYGAVAANILGTGAEELVKGIRHDKINDKVGYDSRIKAADRRAVEEYKRESSGNKKLLMDLTDDKKSEEEKKKSKRKYVAKKTLGGVLRNIPRGAAIGSYIASPGINYYVAGQNDEGKRAKKGFLIGGAITGVGGGLFNYISSKHKTDRLKNMKSNEKKEKELDRLKVGAGVMTEHEFVKKHGGNEK